MSVCLFWLGRRASLKDLCPEDKQRVKQLIEDLARAGAEKEKAETKFAREKKKFRRTLQLLHHEQKKILKEKESILTIHSCVILFIAS